jgi:formylglycine-generating enzyme required for sulfatase activity/uncharacterized caspase-like protein
MGQNWAIAIGINQYRYLQPLHYAVQDAAAMCDYFRNEVRFEQVYYFADSSPPIQQDYGPPLDSVPMFTTLKRFLRSRFEHPFLQTGDNLWFFFAGHGVRHEDRDYLMPIDGDPGEVDGTAIPLSYVTERLRRSGADNVVLLIDACRSEGRRSGVGVGDEVQQGVITLFSCSPRESSYEIDQLQQGAFTHILLQGLRLQGEGNCATVERLDHYLRNSVPALNQQYTKPRQTPYTTVEPAAKYHLILLPRQATLRDAETLKMAAYKAEIDRHYDLAEQFWIRVLAVSPADSDAIAGIRRLAGQSREATSGSAARTNSAGSRRVGTPSSPPSGVSRRRVLQILGFGGAGLGGAIVVSRLLQSPPPEPSPSPTSSLSPRPTPPPSPAPSSVPPSPVPPGPLQLRPVEFPVVTVDEKGNRAKEEKGRAGVFTEDLGAGVLLEMVGIPGGTFTMGSRDDEIDRTTNEGPQRKVTVNAFLMGKYPVTQAQWQAVAKLPKVNADLQPAPAHFKGANLPVEQVSWNDAMEFCARLLKKTEREYRLPSEAEWEYACRARTTTPFHFGPTLTTNLANYNGNYSYGSGPKGEYRQTTTAVGSFSPNAFGLFDMHGNVWEWCLDHWHENYNGAPTDGSAWIAGGESDRRLLRGGSWLNFPRLCRSASRYRNAPDNRNHVIGFRLVCGSAWTL